MIIHLSCVLKLSYICMPILREYINAHWNLGLLEYDGNCMWEITKLLTMQCTSFKCEIYDMMLSRLTSNSLY